MKRRVRGEGEEGAVRVLDHLFLACSLLFVCSLFLAPLQLHLLVGRNQTLVKLPLGLPSSYSRNGGGH